MQRQSGATNDNPTLHQFIKNSDTIHLVGNMWFEDTHGNCRKSAVSSSLLRTQNVFLSENEREIEEPLCKTTLHYISFIVQHSTLNFII